MAFGSFGRICGGRRGGRLEGFVEVMMKVVEYFGSLGVIRVVKCRNVPDTPSCTNNISTRGDV